VLAAHNHQGKPARLGGTGKAKRRRSEAWGQERDSNTVGSKTDRRVSKPTSQAVLSAGADGGDGERHVVKIKGKKTCEYLTKERSARTIKNQTRRLKNRPKDGRSPRPAGEGD